MSVHDQTIGEVLHTIRNACPTKIGIFYAGENAGADISPRTLTYKEIGTLCDHLTRKLQIAVSKGNTLQSHGKIIVGVVLPEKYTVVLPVVLLSILSAGLIATVLDISDPRMPRMAAHIGCDFVIEADNTAGRLNDCTGVSLPSMMISWNRAPLSFTDGKKNCIGLSNAAGAIYFTSGSTGMPKACYWSCAPLLAYAHAKNRIFNITEHSTVFIASPPTFDPSIGDFISAMLAQATIAMASPADIFVNLNGCLRRSSATHVLSTPTLIAQCNPETLPELKVVGIGGEPASRKVVDKWIGSVRVINMYGVTEACVYQAFAELRNGDTTYKYIDSPVGSDITLLGRYQKTTSTGDTEQVSPISDITDGTKFELVISGRHYASARYMTNGSSPSCSAAPKFVKHPTYGFCINTGDIMEKKSVRWCGADDAAPVDSASIRHRAVFLGRKDGMVKINGRRIESGEIEHGILQVLGAAVGQVAVMAHKQRLWAFCEMRAERISGVGTNGVPSEDSNTCADADTEGTALDTLCTKTIRFLLTELLPRYMIPAQICLLWHDRLPTTTSGKVDRKALLATIKAHTHEQHGSQITASASEPLAGWDALVARYWAQEMDLPTEVLTRHSDFRALSGDSMVALRICQRLFDHARARRDRGSADEEATATSTGVFGESLGQLSPVFLLDTPVLCDYAQYLAMRFGDPSDSDDITGAALACAHEPRAAASAAPPDGPDGTSSPGTALPRGTQYSEFRELLCDAVSATVLAAPDRRFLAMALVGALVGDARVTSDRGWKQDTGGTSPASPTNSRHSVAHAEGWDGHVTSALHRAAVVGARSVLPLLLASGARVDARGCDGATPLHVAAQRGHVGVVRDLLASGANVHAVDNNTQSVLHHAARSGAAGTTMLEVLLDAWRGSSGGSTGRRSAVGRREASVDVVDTWARTPLHWAVTNGHRTVVAALLEAGAAVDARDVQGETPLAVAERRAQCRAADRPHGLRPSHFGDIATLLGGNAKTVRLKDITDKPK
eukprot:m.1182726 g.1182726  ORF g.1182726 m.1182726 type:complete len:1015 (-) comp24539_c0_seq2:2003-5047(-)